MLKWDAIRLDEHSKGHGRLQQYNQINSGYVLCARTPGVLKLDLKSQAQPGCNRFELTLPFPQKIPDSSV